MVQSKNNKDNDPGRKLRRRHINLSTQPLGRVSAGLGMKTLNPSVAQRVINHSSPLRRELWLLVRTGHPCLLPSASLFLSIAVEQRSSILAN